MAAVDALPLDIAQLAPIPAGTAPLVVTGMATRSPACALEAAHPIDPMASVPISRWEAEVQLTRDMPARFGGFLAGAFLFDSAAFSISMPGEEALGT